MTKKQPEKHTAKHYSDEELRAFQLAGGVEGGMPAGRSGGPREQAAGKSQKPGEAKDE